MPSFVQVVPQRVGLPVSGVIGPGDGSSCWQWVRLLGVLLVEGGGKDGDHDDLWSSSWSYQWPSTLWHQEHYDVHDMPEGREQAMCQLCDNLHQVVVAGIMMSGCLRTVCWHFSGDKADLQFVWRARRGPAILICQAGSQRDSAEGADGTSCSDKHSQMEWMSSIRKCYQ